MGDLVEGKVVLVTGAASGIGRAAALLFNREGARAVVVADIDVDVGRTRRPKWCARAGGTALALAVDIADARAVDAMVTRTVARVRSTGLRVQQRRRRRDNRHAPPIAPTRTGTS